MDSLFVFLLDSIYNFKCQMMVCFGTVSNVPLKIVLREQIKNLITLLKSFGCVSWADFRQASSYGSLVIDNNILRWSAAPSKSDGYLIKRYKEYRWTLLHRGLWTGTFPLSILAWYKRDFKQILFLKDFSFWVSFFS